MLGGLTSRHGGGGSASVIIERRGRGDGKGRIERRRGGSMTE